MLFAALLWVVVLGCSLLLKPWAGRTVLAAGASQPPRLQELVCSLLFRPAFVIAALLLRHRRRAFSGDGSAAWLLLIGQRIRPADVVAT